jgi:hypothetical protein
MRLQKPCNEFLPVSLSKSNIQPRRSVQRSERFLVTTTVLATEEVGEVMSVECSKECGGGCQRSEECHEEVGSSSNEGQYNERERRGHERWMKVGRRDEQTEVERRNGVACQA